MPVSEEPVTCERCQCTYRTCASYKRHLETCEVISTSESDSEFIQDPELNKDASFTSTGAAELQCNSAAKTSIVAVNVCDGTSEPYVVTSYETFSSYQATQNEVQTASVLNTQTFVSAESTSELLAPPERNQEVFYSVQPSIGGKTVVQPMAQENRMSINSVPTISINKEPAANKHFAVNQPPATLTLEPPMPNAHQYCVNQSIPLCDPSSIAVNQTLNQPISISQTGAIQINQSAINSGVELQSQPIAIHPVSYQQDVSPILNIAPRNQITIDANMLANSCPNLLNSVVTQALNVPQNHQWIKPVVKQPIVMQKPPPVKTARPKPRSLAAKRGRIQGNGAVLIPQTAVTGPSVIVQHLPSPNVVPAFVDTFQQQTGQNLQYLATITPQVNNASPVIQLQPDGNFISLVPGVQPTMVIQQPRVITDQLILDSNGALTWAPQPIYYGFETIVQNTVMQSQQFLPTTVPGVLTANSSYSTTTQVFQTSKLEPVLDVASNSYVLLNSGQLVNSQPVHVPHQQYQPPPQPQPHQQPHQQPQPAPPQQQQQQHHQNNAAFHNPILPAPSSSPQNKQHHVHHVYKPREASNVVRMTYQSPKKHLQPPPATPVNNTNSITLPVAPFVSEQGIPTIVVTPTPKVPTNVQIRPMSRVLPIQTNTKDVKKPVVIEDEKPILPEKEIDPVDPLNKLVDVLENIEKENGIILDDVMKTKQEIYCEKAAEVENELKKMESASLKLIFQKQNQEGVYKISNNFTTKGCSSVQVVPLKPIKSKLLPPPAPLLPQPPTNQNSNTIQNNELPIPIERSEIMKELPPAEPPKITQEKPEPSPQVPAILYTIETQDGFRYSSTSISDLWSKVFDAVQAARIAHNMTPLPSNGFTIINNLQLLGLKTNGLKYLIEQLPGAGKCVKYKPSFYFATSQSESDDDFLIGHSNGAIRCAPHTKRNEPNDMFGWLASKHRKPESSLIDTDLVSR